VLLVAICMGSGAGWWFWPRGDARFVGRWMMREENETEPVGELVLRRHGVGSYTAPGNDYVVSFRWHVEAGNFVIGAKPREGLLSQRLEELSELLLDWTGRTFLTDEVTYQISSVSQNDIKLQEKDSVPVFLKRADAK
jgi:hypothetical protein